MFATTLCGGARRAMAARRAGDARSAENHTLQSE